MSVVNSITVFLCVEYFFASIFLVWTECNYVIRKRWKFDATGFRRMENRTCNVDDDGIAFVTILSNCIRKIWLILTKNEFHRLTHVNKNQTQNSLWSFPNKPMTVLQSSFTAFCTASMGKINYFIYLGTFSYVLLNTKFLHIIWIFIKSILYWVHCKLSK